MNSTTGDCSQQTVYFLQVSSFTLFDLHALCVIESARMRATLATYCNADLHRLSPFLRVKITSVIAE
jgi:hypothetical protein